MKKLLVSVLLLNLLAACASQKPISEIENRLFSAIEVSGVETGIVSATAANLLQTESVKVDRLNTDPVLAERSIYYPFDVYVVQDADKPVVQAHAQYLNEQATRKVRVEGISNTLTRHAVSTRPFDGANTSTFSKLGGLRGSVKGNAIVGLPILVIDTAWSTYDYGGSRALQNAGFYTNLGGSVGGLALGMAVGIPAASVLTTLTGNPMIGGAAGAITALAAGAAGNIGGRTVTRKILVAVKPDLIYKPEDQMVSDAKKNIEDSISRKLKGIEL